MDGQNETMQKAFSFANHSSSLRRKNIEKLLRAQADDLINNPTQSKLNVIKFTRELIMDKLDKEIEEFLLANEQEFFMEEKCKVNNVAACEKFCLDKGIAISDDVRRRFAIGEHILRATFRFNFQKK